MNPGPVLRGARPAVRRVDFFAIMPEFIPVLSREAIQQAVASLAEKISEDYKGKRLVLVGVLKGAFVFLSDLARHISLPLEIDFVCAASYGSATRSSGEVRLTKKLDVDIQNKDVLVVEDIIDTGLTLAYLVEYLKSFAPRTLRVCALIDKHERRQKNIQADYVGQVISEGFLVGYGLDYDEHYRNLPEIYHLKF